MCTLRSVYITYYTVWPLKTLKKYEMKEFSPEHKTKHNNNVQITSRKCCNTKQKNLCAVLRVKNPFGCNLLTQLFNYTQQNTSTL